MHGIHPCIAGDLVVARAAEDLVLSIVAMQMIGADTAVDIIIPRPATTKSSPSLPKIWSLPPQPAGSLASELKIGNA